MLGYEGYCLSGVLLPLLAGGGKVRWWWWLPAWRVVALGSHEANMEQLASGSKFVICGMNWRVPETDCNAGLRCELWETPNQTLQRELGLDISGIPSTSTAISEGNGRELSVFSIAPSSFHFCITHVPILAFPSSTSCPPFHLHHNALF